MSAIRKKIMGLDFSWDRSAQEYIDVYESIATPREKPVVVALKPAEK